MKPNSCRIFLLAGVLALASPVSAGTVTDNFSVSRNYLTEGVAGTVWEGVYFGAGEFNNVSIAGVPGRSLKVDANVTAAGKLSVQTTETAWEFGDDDGFFLYKVVKGDFQAAVKIVTPFDNIAYHSAGLMARAFGPGGDPLNGSENNVTFTRFDEFGFANYGRSTVNNDTARINPGDPEGADLYWLMLERVGNTFTCYHKAAEADPWIPASGCSFERPDLDGLPVQVGIIQATFSANTPVAQFEKFSLTGPNVGVAQPASPTGLTMAEAGSGALALSWTPGAGSAGSLVVMRPLSPVSRQPSNFTSYNGAPSFGAGTALGGTNFVVYAGSGNSVTVTELTPSVVYHASVYAWSGSGDTAVYSLTPASGSKAVAGALTSITLSLATNTVAVDDTLQAAAVAGFQGGGTLDVTANATFSSLHPDLASVSPAGLISAKAAGVASIVVNYQGFSNTQAVTVIKLPVTDDFSVARNYLTEGLGGTPWQGLRLGADDLEEGGVVAGGPGQTLVFDAGVTTPGRLTIKTTQTDWENDADDGLFLYRMVAGNFKVQVQVTAFDPTAYNFAGVMARLPFDGLEDYVCLATFNQFGIGNYVRSVASGITANGPFTAVPAKPFIMLEREGTTFRFYEKAHALDPWTLAHTLERPDFENQPLQVGIAQACFSGNAPVTEMANFNLESSDPVPPGKPGPAKDLVLSRAGTGSVTATWTPGTGSAGSLVIMRAVNGVTRQPLDGATYSAQDQLGAGNIVVYVGSGNSVTVPNLPAVRHYFAVYSYAQGVYNLEAAHGSLEVLGPPTITQSPTSVAVYAGRPAVFKGAATGTSPLAFQWQKGGVNVTDGPGISGATTPTLTLASVTAQDAGAYKLLVSNEAGQDASSEAALTVVAPSGSSYEASVMSYSPAAYWRFSEAAAATTTFDWWGGFNGTVLAGATLGSPGPRPSDGIALFGESNTGAYFDGTAVSAPITTPALNLNTARVTMMAWVNPASLPNSDRAGFFTCTGPATAGAGFRYATGGEYLGLLWNNTAINSTIPIPANEWSFIAVSVSPTEAVLYLGKPGSPMVREARAGDYPVQGFDGTGLIGSDRNVGGRYFMGAIDEMAIFNATLSEQDVANIFQGITRPEDVRLSVSHTPGGPLVLRWPGSATGYNLQTTPTLGSGLSWGSAGVTPVLVEGVYQAEIPIGTGPAFYRLAK